MNEKKNMYTCVLCGKTFEGFGNNPEPVAHNGRCCDECNERVIIPARLSQILDNKRIEDN